MNFEKMILDKASSNSIFSEWLKEKEDIKSQLDGSVSKVRDDLLKLYNDTLEELGATTEASYRKNLYQIDVHFGVKLYEYLNSYDSFNVRIASNNNFWRFISIKVIPDVVYDRGGLKEDYFWKTPRRIWLKRIWWYIHLSWQDNAEDTLNILRSNTTDEISQLVERAGPSGYRVNLTREIMKVYGTYSQENRKRSEALFRKVMKLNTAKVETIEPELFPKGVHYYARSLFEYFES